MKYDVALSFAGEDREYVDQVAGHLRRAGVAVFYDKYEQVDLWGKDLYEHLSDVYKNKARYTVMFVSHHYAEKLWTRHERKSAQARAFRESSEYILPARFDNSDLPGLTDTVGYLNLRDFSPAQLAEAIRTKLVSSGVALAPEPARPSGGEEPATSPETVTVLVRSEESRAISGADILLVASNGTHLRQHTNTEGEARFDVSKRRTLTVFCAHPNRAAFVGPEFDPVRDFAITLPAIADTGSLINLGDWDTIPGLKGSMSPIHDSFDRLYVYTKNIAVDEGKLQPVYFEVDTPMHFEDPDGQQRFVTFRAVVANCFLVEYRDPRPAAA